MARTMLIDRLRRELSEGRLNLPLPGSGATRKRHTALYGFGQADLSLARLAEAHTDAVAILAEGGCEPRREALYGVWAAEGPNGALELQETSNGRYRLEGVKKYCSGAPLLDAALVTAKLAGKSALVDVSLRAPGIAIDTHGWATPAFGETGTANVTFIGVEIGQDRIVGTDNWYLDRPGFWHGALGPAACWAGGAAGLVDAARALGRSDPHSLAQLGALESNAWAMKAVLNQAAEEIDADPADRANHRMQRALQVRHIIERLCTDTLDRFGRATGPQLLAFDADVAQRHAELALYIRQCHAERDLQALAACIRANATAD